ncbi:unnamed protein product [Rhizoctonia solani]|uniref:Uncharacterized protein n=1 Tax=Rhizoctonia solani TaxID=456999 RepID=A0A8H3C844_9AGAM|nr:unnamed protein product [Rhizoctonia solani]
MGFYWPNNGDQLLARRGKLSGDSLDLIWTSFEMPLRTSAPMPGSPLKIVQFVTTALAFMDHVRTVSILFNDRCLAKAEKEVSLPRRLTIPDGSDLRSPDGIMNITKITSNTVYMKATVLRWAYNAGSAKATTLSHPATKPASILPYSPSSVSLSLSDSFAPVPWHKAEKDPQDAIKAYTQLSVFTAEASTQLNTQLNDELRRATKELLPPTITYQMIYTGKDEYDASLIEDRGEFDNANNVFHGLRADLHGSDCARIYIGHATGQASGIGGHIRAPFIPTVEREAIDLVDRHVLTWNKELLHVGGLLARVVYELEMASINEVWGSSSDSISIVGQPREEDRILQLWLKNRCSHMLQFFTTRPTVPSPIVAECFRTAFLASIDSRNQPFPIISTLGVRPARDVRNYNEALVGILKKTPMLTREIATENRTMLTMLRKYEMCMDVGPQDILEELKDRVLDEQQVVTLLRWWAGIGYKIRREDAQNSRETFFLAVNFSLKNQTKEAKVISLALIKRFVSPQVSMVLHDGPLPEDTLPIIVSGLLSDLNISHSFGWSQLSVPDWIAHLVDSKTEAGKAVDFNLDTMLAEKILTVIATAWLSLSSKDRKRVSSQLANVPCIPTQFGLMVPTEAYLVDADEFPDLPVVIMPSGMPTKGGEKALIEVGVKLHVELNTICSRMTQGDEWAAARFIKYLVRVRHTLSQSEMDHLKLASVFLREGEEHEQTARTSHTVMGPKPKLMYELGLKRFPPLETILMLATADDSCKRMTALNYFLHNYDARYTDYRAESYQHCNFVPAIKPGGESCLTSPTGVYSNPECVVMGVNVIDPNFDKDAVIKLQIAIQPSTEVLLKLLSINPPCDRDKAQKCYEYMASRIADFLPAELGYMAEIAFIPAPETKNLLQIDAQGSRVMLKPTQVYLRDGAKTEYEKSGVFTFVEFEGRAVIFLKAVGVKSAPTTEDVCKIMIQDPEGFRNAIGGYERYLDELERISTQIDTFEPSIIKQLSFSPIFVGTKRVVESFIESSVDQKFDSIEHQDPIEFEYKLLSLNEIVIIDDVHSYALFGHEIWGAPQEDNIEVFYETLGAQRLSTLTSTNYTFLPVQNHLEAQEHANYVRALVLERLLLFLYNLTHIKRRVEIEWLIEGSNFQVRMVRELQITRTLKYARTRSVAQKVSAAAMQEEFGRPVILEINQGLELDFYEVASSMCNILFEKNKISNNMLFMTILSTSLTALKRRGYNVDRIIHQKDLKKAWAKCADSQFWREITESGTAKVTPVVHVTQRIACPPAGENIKCPSPELRVTGYNKGTGLEGSIQPIPLGGPSRSTAAPQRESLSIWDRHKEKLQMAISFCRPENQSLLNKHRQEMAKGELRNRIYFDVIGSISNLVPAGSLAGYGFYISSDLSNPSYLVAKKCQPMGDFGRLVVEPLRKLYSLPQSSIKIYYDPKASGSFNKEDVILLNLAYYEERHNEAVNEGSLHQALTYWYFRLARTMARIACHPQNDQHGCYLRLIVESHMPEFLVLLSQCSTQVL